MEGQLEVSGGSSGGQWWVGWRSVEDQLEVSGGSTGGQLGISGRAAVDQLQVSGGLWEGAGSVASLPRALVLLSFSPWLSWASLHNSQRTKNALDASGLAYMLSLMTCAGGHSKSQDLACGQTATSACQESKGHAAIPTGPVAQVEASSFPLPI